MATPKMQRRKPGEHPVSSGTDKPSPNLVHLGVNRTSMDRTLVIWCFHAYPVDAGSRLLRRSAPRNDNPSLSLRAKRSNLAGLSSRLGEQGADPLHQLGRGVSALGED